jgi:hypothetical protein
MQAREKPGNPTQDFHPSHRPWKSLRDSHIPTRTTIPLIINREHRTDSEKCYLCPRIEVLPMFPVGQTGNNVYRR